MKRIDVKSVKVNPKSKKAVAKKPTAYQTNVLHANAELKNVRKSFGGCIKMLLSNAKEIGLNAQFVKVLRFIQKDDKAYSEFKATVRTSKYKGKDLGTYSPFYVLQALHRAIEAEKSAK